MGMADYKTNRWFTESRIMTYDVFTGPARANAGLANIKGPGSGGGGAHQ